MNTCKTFAQLGVKSKNLTGDKLEIVEIINKQVMVIDYRVGDSKFSRGTCLTIQIEYNGENRIIFTGSHVLLEEIEALPKDAFPFTTTIIKVPFKERQFFLKFT